MAIEIVQSGLHCYQFDGLMIAIRLQLTRFAFGEDCFQKESAFQHFRLLEFERLEPIVSQCAICLARIFIVLTHTFGVLRGTCQ